MVVTFKIMFMQFTSIIKFYLWHTCANQCQNLRFQTDNVLPRPYYLHRHRAESCPNTINNCWKLSSLKHLFPQTSREILNECQTTFLISQIKTVLKPHTAKCQHYSYTELRLYLTTYPFMSAQTRIVTLKWQWYGGSRITLC